MAFDKESFKNRKLLTIKIMRLKAAEAYIYKFRYSSWIFNQTGVIYVELHFHD